MIKTEKRVNQIGVPILCKIPILGRLFRSDSTKNVKTETIVFLKPIIITGEEPFLQMPDEAKNLRFRTNGGNGTNGNGQAAEKEIKTKRE
jgi:type II secretory pathway component GspD/PulD (secretin)